MRSSWDEGEASLRERADALRAQLGLDAELARVGVATLTGSAALRLMVARDIDVTIAVPSLSATLVREVAALAARLAERPDVREVLVRDDTGSWNLDPAYPDGVYLHVVARDDAGEMWTLDLWFVDEPERQPDLAHLRTILPRITPEAQQRILTIKRAAGGRRPDGTRLPSYDIYRAVLDHDARTVADLERLTETRE